MPPNLTVLYCRLARSSFESARPEVNMHLAPVDWFISLVCDGAAWSISLVLPQCVQRVWWWWLRRVWWRCWVSLLPKWRGSSPQLSRCGSLSLTGIIIIVHTHTLHDYIPPTIVWVEIWNILRDFGSKSTSNNCPILKNSTRESNQHHREKITKPPQKI